MIIVALQVAVAAMGQDSWELKVCAAPHDFPASSREQPGFDNRIVEILADEMDASVTYVWTPINTQAVTQLAHAGECDVVMGVGDGAAGLSSTVAYYRTPYVFMVREGEAGPIMSLDDAGLENLRIGTYPNSGPHRALIEYGLGDNFVPVAPESNAGGPDYVTPLTNALLGGSIDVALLYGPDAGQVMKRHPGEFVLEPIQPEIVPPMFQMFRIATIGVRPGDEALRDRLNIALARRWKEIHAVLRDYGVPLQSVTEPRAPETESVAPRVGVVLPLPTSVPLPTDGIARAARAGALLGEELAGRDAAPTSESVDVLFASAPTAASARRAARRLTVTEGVSAIIGGIGEGHTDVLSFVAEEQEVLFFDIGSNGLESLSRCNPNTFHVGAGAGVYLQALFEWYSDRGVRRWFIVHDDSMTGQALSSASLEVLSMHEVGGESSGAAEVNAGSLIYYQTLAQIRQASPDAVLLLLPPAEQEFFLSQFESEGLTPLVVPFPHALSQSREFATRLRQVAPETSSSVRAALWEANLERFGALELNERYASSTGDPMDPTAWAAYAAVAILQQAVEAVGIAEAETLSAYLVSPDAAFDVRKSMPVSFRQQDRQLLQPLYLVANDRDADWGPRLTNRLDLVDLVAEFPDLELDGAERLRMLEFAATHSLDCPTPRR